MVDQRLGLLMVDHQALQNRFRLVILTDAEFPAAKVTDAFLLRRVKYDVIRTAAGKTC